MNLVTDQGESSRGPRDSVEIGAPLDQCSILDVRFDKDCQAC